MELTEKLLLTDLKFAKHTIECAMESRRTRLDRVELVEDALAMLRAALRTLNEENK